jgi:hypothetical protein
MVSKPKVKKQAMQILRSREVQFSLPTEEFFMKEANLSKAESRSRKSPASAKVFYMTIR